MWLHYRSGPDWMADKIESFEKMFCGALARPSTGQQYYYSCTNGYEI